MTTDGALSTWLVFPQENGPEGNLTPVLFMLLLVNRLYKILITEMINPISWLFLILCSHYGKKIILTEIAWFLCVFYRRDE